MSRPVLGGLTAAALTAALLLAAAGCSDTPAAPTTLPAAAPSPTTTAPVSGEHGPADVAFAAAMIPHHEQAITMAEQATTRASSPQVTDLARRIAGAQGPEIDRMHGMLAAWDVPSTAAPAMPGMMSDAEMAQLGALSGPAFDRAFLQMMIGHHSGAVTMARAELAQGRNPQARALASAIIDAQQREIGEMTAMLAQS